MLGSASAHGGGAAFANGVTNRGGGGGASGGGTTKRTGGSGICVIDGYHLVPLTGSYNLITPTVKLSISPSSLASSGGCFMQSATFTSAVSTVLPAGSIAMWSGTAATVPLGWLICDGQNGTPDLRGRFILGSANTLGTGGSNLVTLSAANMPSHAHSGLTDGMSVSGIHSHSLSQATNDNNSFDSGTNQYPVTDDNETLSRNIFTDNTDLSHTHTMVIDAAGSGASFSVVPPFYSLFFIMRV